MDSRLELAHQWLTGFFNHEDFEISVLSDDASFRRYFRVQYGYQHYALMDAPPDKESCHPFLAIAKTWHQAGIPVPLVYAVDLEQGFMLLEDFGDTTFLARAGTDAEKLYPQALEMLLAVHQAPIPQDYPLPPFDESMCRFELGIFKEWFLEKLLGLSLSPEQSQCLNHTFDLLTENAQSQPQVVMHRDYHSRNLMVREDDSLGLIDFQGAVIGPIAYDVASLLKDCYICWPEEQVATWLNDYLDILNDYRAQQGEQAYSKEAFQRWFDLIGMQRHIKVAGLFSRLSLRDNKHGYLQDIPLTLEYILSASRRYPELEAFRHWLEDELQPMFNQYLQSLNKSEDSPCAP
ncbi:aminoglycoside phosphotransferase family protein [Hahella ganghwensis]|uniref:aminoglycoside phosphotransferase family protein n=1 Tax=Hahella ganghwensis TaxID=286420 RepID=UPI000375C74E|nr:phosphotransferase [Hahella ganghwensis]